jgi:toxin ParE1/3/4
MRVRFHPAARVELHEAGLWYDDDYPGRGERFRNAIAHELERVLTAPLSFPTWRGRKDVRVCVVPRFPYSVIFVADTEGVAVYAVAHHKRRPGYWQKRVDG